MWEVVYWIEVGLRNLLVAVFHPTGGLSVNGLWMNPDLSRKGSIHGRN